MKKQLQIAEKILSSIKGYEVDFHRYNFLHLSGGILNERGTASAIHFYQKCLDKRFTDNDCCCKMLVGIYVVGRSLAGSWL